MTHDPVTQRAPHKAVIMARGLGTRMRKAAVGVSLTAEHIRDSGTAARYC